MSLGDRVSIPNQEESADGQNADECALPSTQHTSLENDLEPKRTANCEGEHRHVTEFLHTRSSHRALWYGCR